MVGFLIRSLVVLLLVLLFSYGFGATVVLKNGSIIKGDIKSIDADPIEIKVDGIAMKFHKKDILYIDLEDTLEVQLGIPTKDIKDKLQSSNSPEETSKSGNAKEANSNENIFNQKVDPHFKHFAFGFHVGTTGVDSFETFGPGVNATIHMNPSISFEMYAHFGMFEDFAFGWGGSMRFHLDTKIFGWKPYVGVGWYDVFGTVTEPYDIYDYYDYVGSSREYQKNQLFVAFPISLLYFESKFITLDLGLTNVLFSYDDINVTVEFARIGIRL